MRRDGEFFEDMINLVGEFIDICVNDWIYASVALGVVGFFLWMVL